MSTPPPLSSDTRPSRGDGHCTGSAVLAPSPEEAPLEREEIRYRREDRSDPVATAVIARSVQRTLEMLGEDPSREGLLKTPERVAKAYQFLTHGAALDPRAILSSALFREDYDEMVVVRDIEFFSLCEHHMLPFFGKAHIAYVPDGRVVGLSKLPRVVDVFARRLQVQERLTVQIRDALRDVLQPRGVAVVVEATHLCMVMRGVQKQQATTVTSAMSGVFADDAATRDAFMRHLRA